MPYLRGGGQAVAVQHGAVTQRERVARAHDAQEGIHRQLGRRRAPARELALRRHLRRDGLRGQQHLTRLGDCVKRNKQIMQTPQMLQQGTEVNIHKREHS